jgi:hypothetical protein
MHTMTTRQQKAAERKAFRARQAQLRTEGLAVVATGRCPCCGQGIHQNLSITGWWQCDGYGADGFRKNGATPCPGGWQVIIPRERDCA